MKRIKIAIDGPSGSGKSTTAKHLAKRLDYIYIDTGAMYRTIALAWLRSGTEFSEENVKALLPGLDIKFKNEADGQHSFLNNEDVSDKIRSMEVAKGASDVSAFKSVRDFLLGRQRDLAANGGVVMDGRDIGTVVLPDAELKIFLVASADVRALRRHKELADKGVESEVEEIKRQLLERDKNDSERAIAPLKKADDAIEIDTSGLTIEGQVEEVYKLANKIINNGIS